MHENDSDLTLFFLVSIPLLQTRYLRPSTDGLRRSLRKNVECLAVLEHIQYDPADPNPTGPPEVWVCEFKNGEAFELLDLENLPPEIGDDLESGIDALTIPNALVTKTSIKIPQGAAVGRKKLEKWEDWYPGRGKGRGDNVFSRGNQGSTNRRLLTDGIRTVLVVRVIASNGITTDNLIRLSDSVFGNGVDPVNLASQYDACSYGQLQFVKAADKTGSSTNILNGAVEVTVATATSEGDVAMRNAIATELNSQFGVTSPTALADYVMMCLPPDTMSGIACKWRKISSARSC